MTTRLLVGVMATMAAANAAVAKSLGEMAEDAERDLKIMTGFFEVAFYMLGILVFVFGLFRVKKHMDQPQQVSLWSAGVAMVVGPQSSRCRRSSTESERRSGSPAGAGCLRRDRDRPENPMLSELQRLSWAARRKPLESFLLPVAAVNGCLLCRDFLSGVPVPDRGCPRPFRPARAGAVCRARGRPAEQPVPVSRARAARDVRAGGGWHRACARPARPWGGARNVLGSGSGTCSGNARAALRRRWRRSCWRCWTRPSAASSLERRATGRSGSWP